MSSTTDPLAWAAKADEDYALARAALRRRTPLTSGAAFHAQQCAEKYLKAALVARGQVFPKTHDLLTLSVLCAQVGLVVPVDAAALSELSDHAVFTRYPGGDPTSDEALAAITTARAVRRFVRKALGLKAP
jgi:HEPN domain-containing protein